MGPRGMQMGLHNEELYNLYCPPNKVMVNKSIRLRWASNVGRMKEGRSALKFLKNKPKERDL